MKCSQLIRYTVHLHIQPSGAKKTCLTWAKTWWRRVIRGRWDITSSSFLLFFPRGEEAKRKKKEASVWNQLPSRKKKKNRNSLCALSGEVCLLYIWWRKMMTSTSTWFARGADTQGNKVPASLWRRSWDKRWSAVRSIANALAIAGLGPSSSQMRCAYRFTIYFFVLFLFTDEVFGDPSSKRRPLECSTSASETLRSR